MRATGALDDAPELARVLAERARALAPSASMKDGALVIVGHGPETAEDHALWMQNCRRLAAQVKALTGFRDVRVGLVRDDAPPDVRAEAVRGVRDIIELQAAATRGKVVVVPMLISKGSVSRDRLPRDLEGLPVVYAADGVVPHAEIARWVERQVRESVATPKNRPRFDTQERRAALIFLDRSVRFAGRQQYHDPWSGIPVRVGAPYIARVRNAVVSRLAALVIASVVGGSAPGLAVAHGHAHHEAEHAAGIHDYGAAADPNAVNASHHGLISAWALDASRDHDHPHLALAVSVRMDAPLLLPGTMPATIIAEIVFAGAIPSFRTGMFAPAGPANDTPRQPRAPPLG